MKICKKAAVLPALCLISAVCSAELVTSWESGTDDGWGIAEWQGVSATVNTDRSSDGIYSVGGTYTVPVLGGQTDHQFLTVDPRSFLSSGSTELSIDVFQAWGNPEGWGVYANDIVIFAQGSDQSWTQLTKVGGSLSEGEFATLTYDVSGVADNLLNSNWAQFLVRWRLGTWTDNSGSADGGSMTLAFDNVQVIPEPGTIGLVAVFGGGLLFIRRRLKIG